MKDFPVACMPLFEIQIYNVLKKKDVLKVNDVLLVETEIVKSSKILQGDKDVETKIEAIYRNTDVNK